LEAIELVEEERGGAVFGGLGDFEGECGGDRNFFNGL
jgi:hypothetical protein